MYKIENRFHTLVLTPSPDDSLTLQAILQIECDIINKSPKTELMFKDGIITRGYNDQPGYVFRDLRINGKPIEFHEQTGSNNRRSISCSAKAYPNARNHVYYVEEFQVRRDGDFISRLITTDSKNVRVTLKYPKALKPTIKWKIPQETIKKIRRHKRTSIGSFNSYSEELSENMKNGEGFEILWSIKKCPPSARMKDVRKNLGRREMICFSLGLILTVFGVFFPISANLLETTAHGIIVASGIVLIVLGLGFSYFKIKTGLVELEARY